MNNYMWETEDTIAEQQELVRKQTELDRACANLIDEELKLWAIEDYINDIEMQYYHDVGSYKIELYELQAKLARWRYQLNPLDKKLQELVDNYSIELELIYDKFELSKNYVPSVTIEDRTLINSYKDALVNTHSIKAHNLVNQQKRELWCKRLKEAFKQQNLNEILQINKMFSLSIDAIEDGDIVTLLINTIRKIYRANLELKRINKHIDLLRESEFYQLGRDLNKKNAQKTFQPMIDDLIIQINQLKHEVDEIQRDTATVELSASFYPESLKHLTEKGEKVRSKSEVIIANMLYRLGIPYFYEQALTGTVIKGEKYPDFTIYNCNNQAILWEHLGLLHDEYYKYRWHDKLTWYEANGFILGFNLFVTRDELDASIDSRKIGNVAKFIKTLL